MEEANPVATVWMTPEELMGRMMGDLPRSGKTLDEQVDQERTSPRFTRVLKRMKEGRTIDPPALYFGSNDSDPDVIAGTHRALAAYSLGIRSLPVEIYGPKASAYLRSRGR